MASFGQYLANFAYDLIFFSSDVQTTTIAMAITGSLCYTIMWAIVHIITLIHDPPIPGAAKTDIVPTGLSPLSRQNSYPHKQTLQNSFMSTSSLDIVCLRCGCLLSDQRCKYGMCAGCCLGRRQCQVHQNIPPTSPANSEVSMGLRISGPKGLDFSNNSMQSVPERLGFVGAQLTFLNLSSNNLTELPPDIGCLQGLRELQISDNKLVNIPVTIGTLSNLCELDLRNNQLSNIPETLWQLSSLKYLNLEYNQLSSLSSLVCRLILLEELYLGSNRLTALPSAIGKLFNLKMLSVRHNPLSSLPSSVGQLICLDQLDLVHCHLTSLPPSLGHCLSLRKLSLCHNRLSYLPSQLCQLQRLRELYVTNNSLSSFPASMENMALNMFEISGNPLITSDTTVVISSRGSTEACTFPPLMELVARQIVYKKIRPLHLLPHSLQEYLRSWKQCSWCRGPVFQYYRSHIRHGFVGRYHILVPLKETLCSPHLKSQCQRKYSHTSSI